MKFATVSKSVILGLAVLLASSAFAATKGNLHLDSATLVNGTTLKAGDYKVEWDGTGPNVDVSIIQGRTVVAKVPAKIVDLNTPAQQTATLVIHNDNGTTALTGARFEGKKIALDLSPSTDAMQTGSSR